MRTAQAAGPYHLAAAGGLAIKAGRPMLCLLVVSCVLPAASSAAFVVSSPTRNQNAHDVFFRNLGSASCSTASTRACTRRYPLSNNIRTSIGKLRLGALPVFAKLESIEENDDTGVQRQGRKQKSPLSTLIASFLLASSILFGVATAPYSTDFSLSVQPALADDAVKPAAPAPAPAAKPATTTTSEKPTLSPFEARLKLPDLELKVSILKKEAYSIKRRIEADRRSITDLQLRVKNAQERKENDQYALAKEKAAKERMALQIKEEEGKWKEVQARREKEAKEKVGSASASSAPAASSPPSIKQLKSKEKAIDERVKVIKSRLDTAETDLKTYTKDLAAAKTKSADTLKAKKDNGVALAKAEDVLKNTRKISRRQVGMNPAFVSATLSIGGIGLYSWSRRSKGYADVEIMDYGGGGSNNYNNNLMNRGQRYFQDYNNNRPYRREQPRLAGEERRYERERRLLQRDQRRFELDREQRRLEREQQREYDLLAGRGYNNGAYTDADDYLRPNNAAGRRSSYGGGPPEPDRYGRDGYRRPPSPYDNGGSGPFPRNARGANGRYDEPTAPRRRPRYDYKYLDDPVPPEPPRPGRGRPQRASDDRWGNSLSQWD